MASSGSPTFELAKALGLPKHTRHAVLTLEAGQPPRLELEMLCVDAQGHLIVESDPAGSCAGRLASVQFMLRLEPFKETPKP